MDAMLIDAAGHKQWPGPLPFLCAASWMLAPHSQV